MELPTSSMSSTVNTGDDAIVPGGSSLTSSTNRDGIDADVSSVSGDHSTSQENAHSSKNALFDDGNKLELPGAEDVQKIDSSSNAMDAENLNASNANEDEDIDSASEISDFSDFSQESWHPVQGPIAWVQEQMRKGQNARSILEDLIPPGTVIPDDIDPVMMWRLIINIVSEPPKRKKLENINTLEDVVDLFQKCKKIIVLTGAGVSVSCGIPDFRSRDGVYARLAVDFPNLPDPQAMFDINFFRSDPRPFFKFAKEIYPGQFKPSLCHHFIRLIESQGRLLRNYTQNIDTLEQEAGIERVVQCHGSFATATCTNCKRKVKSDMIREDIFNQVIPKCPQCPKDTENAIMKPDIVFFGESLPEDFHKQMAADKDECDLLIVIGSSLKVRPVALIPNSVPADVPQILINRERLHYLSFDVELLGNCDEIVSELCRRLGSGWDQLAANESPLNEVALSNLPTPPVSPQNRNHSSPKPVSRGDKRTNDDNTDNAPSQSDTTQTSNTGSASIEHNKEGVDKKMCNVVELPSGSDLTSEPSGDKDNAIGAGDQLANQVKHPSESVESVSSSNTSTLPTSVDTAVSEVIESKTTVSDVSLDEVSTSTALCCSDNSHKDSVSQQRQHGDGEKSSTSDAVTSTSSGGDRRTNHHHSHHHHHHNHLHSHHHNHEHHHHHKRDGHHKHDGHHHHHHHHKHHHHRQHHEHHQSSSSSSGQQAIEKENDSDLEPVEKRPRLECDKDGQAQADTDAALTSSMSPVPGVSDKQEDDELVEMRNMWQGRTNRISLAQRLADDQFLFLPPNRYVFKGAEVFSDDEDDEVGNDDDDDDDDDKVEDESQNENENSNLSTDEKDEQEADGIEPLSPTPTTKDVSSLLEESSKSKPVAYTSENSAASQSQSEKDQSVSSTNGYEQSRSCIGSVSEAEMQVDQEK